jgi:hypothetical protein
VDDGEVAKDTDDHVMLADVLDRGAATDLRKKGLAVDEGTVGVGVEKSAARLASNQATYGLDHGELADPGGYCGIAKDGNSRQVGRSLFE